MQTSNGQELLGALDLGGQSLQVVFDPAAPPVVPTVVTRERVWAKSFDGLGMERMREAIDARVLKLRFMRQKHGEGGAGAPEGVPEDVGAGPDGGNVTAVRHPCFNSGYKFAPSLATLALAGPGAANAAAVKGWRFEGSGNAEACKLLLDDELARRRAAHGGAARCRASSCTLDGTLAPPPRGNFVATSGFFIAADALRVLSGNRRLAASWPRPTPGELLSATDDFCALPFTVLSAPPLSTAHTTTPPARMPIRCFQSAYANALFGAEGLGLRANTRNVTFGATIDGVTVQWPLGALLHEMSTTAHALVEEEVDIVVCKVRRSAFGMMLVLLVLFSACAFQVLMMVALKGSPLFSLRMDAGMLWLVLCGSNKGARRARKSWRSDGGGGGGGGDDGGSDVDDTELL